jgi:YqaJ-like viral recombinase domain
MSEDLEQGTPEWFDARAGHVTASRINAVMAKGKGGAESVTRSAYVAQLVFERLAGKSLEEEKGNFFDIKRGKDLEAVARVEYSLRNRVEVDTIGFVKHPTLAWAGCSPDGTIGKTGLAQFKAPRRHVHLEWFMKGVVPSEHRDQMLFELACLPEREYNDFVSYRDDLDDVPQWQIFQVRLKPDLSRIAEIEAAVAKFNAEVEAKMAKLTSREKSLEELLRESVWLQRHRIERVTTFKEGFNGEVF